MNIPGYLERGSSTAVSTNVHYRLGKLQAHNLLRGRWLDCGCADGGYTVAMAEQSVEQIIGIDVEIQRVLTAQRKKPPFSSINYGCAVSESLPFADWAFDGVFLNEVFEHVADEFLTLQEIYRVLRPGGHLVLISPNRYFPFEGHGMRIGKLNLGFPVPFLPWLPGNITMRFMHARNYWPNELRDSISRAGFEVILIGTVFPVLEVYPWLPTPAIRWYRRMIPLLERIPVIQKFGVSTFILAKRSDQSPRL